MDTHIIPFNPRQTAISPTPDSLYPMDVAAVEPDLSTRFVLILAHEIRNPLNNINLSTEMLASEITDPRLKIYVDVLKRNAARISSLVNTLLKYQQGEETRIEKQSMHQLLEEVLLMEGDRITLKGITIVKGFDGPDCTIDLNRQKIMIALTNIIVNAIDAMTRDKGVLKVTTKSHKRSFSVLIQDNGCGISRENLGNIFKPFFTNKPGGIGFGLAATYGILKANHVGVTVQTEEGKGTQFTLTFHKNSSAFTKNVYLPY